MFRLLFLFSLIILINSKTIFPWNLTTIAKKTSTLSTQTTAMETSTILDISTTTTYDPPTTATIEYAEQTTTTTTLNNKFSEFQSNFSRNNDSVFVSLHSNAMNTLVSINNTFTSSKYDIYPCEILFNEYSIYSNITKTTILINFNRTFTRDLATQLGDRLIDIADLLVTIRLMENQNNNTETV